MNYNEEEGNKFIEELFEKSALPSLCEFGNILNLSKHFDKNYKTKGLLQKAGNHIKSWLEGLGLKGLQSQLLQSQDQTPVLFSEVQGQIKDQTILFYGHFDKKCWGNGWNENKCENKPVIENDKLYGRGCIDDGLSIYTSALAIRALQQQKVSLPKIIFLAERDEQSGTHIVEHLKRLKNRLGNIDLMFILNSEVVDYNNFWITKSIKGQMKFNIKIKVLEDGVHSGDGSGIVPSTFKIANKLISRFENFQTGQLISLFQRDVPSVRYSQFYENAKLVGMGQFKQIKTIQGLQFQNENVLQTLLKRGWKPTLTVRGLTGFPPVATAGNLMLPQIKIGISIRLPPTFNNFNPEAQIIKILTENTPFNCSVKLENFKMGYGWNSPAYEQWFQDIIHQSSKQIFGSKAYSCALGAEIPIVNCLAKAFPKANVLVTGAFGPNSNAHGPNESLDFPYAKKIAMVMALIVGRSSAHYNSLNK